MEDTGAHQATALYPLLLPAATVLLTSIQTLVDLEESQSGLSLVHLASMVQPLLLDKPMWLANSDG